MPSITRYRHEMLCEEAAARREAYVQLTDLLHYLGGPKFSGVDKNWVNATEMYWKLADLRSALSVYAPGDLPILPTNEEHNDG